ncbi:Uncharacterized protein APZ42_011219 [Daphnia magna]|uniref:Uncharacterized protein n=1 Tax=Daphnia magna TaxID=35525 RepID=A0A162CYQ2_9CRUS|nr:Uncharacterized protein APZ42_011219 [Daphnia magna]
MRSHFQDENQARQKLSRQLQQSGHSIFYDLDGKNCLLPRLKPRYDTTGSVENNPMLLLSILLALRLSWI